MSLLLILVPCVFRSRHTEPSCRLRRLMCKQEEALQQPARLVGAHAHTRGFTDTFVCAELAPFLVSRLLTVLQGVEGETPSLPASVGRSAAAIVSSELKGFSGRNPGVASSDVEITWRGFLVKSAGDRFSLNSQQGASSFEKKRATLNKRWQYCYWRHPALATSDDVAFTDAFISGVCHIIFRAFVPRCDAVSPSCDNFSFINICFKYRFSKKSQHSVAGCLLCRPAVPLRISLSFGALY